MTEVVDHPVHYNAFDIEAIDVVEHFNFNRGSAMKYIWRAGLKGDNAIQDLEKAKWYVHREIQRLRKEQDLSFCCQRANEQGLVCACEMNTGA